MQSRAVSALLRLATIAGALALIGLITVTIQSAAPAMVSATIASIHAVEDADALLRRPASSATTMWGSAGATNRALRRVDNGE